MSKPTHQELEACVIKLQQENSELLESNKILQEREQMYREMAEVVPAIFWVSSPDGKKIHYVSPRYEEVYGRSCESAYTDENQWQDIIHPEDLNYVIKTIEKLHGQKYGMYYRIMRPDGSFRWIHDCIIPVRDEAGNLLRMIGFGEDITDRRKTEKALLESEAKYRTLVATMTDAIMVFDADTKIFIEINTACETLYGYTREEFLQLNIFDVSAEPEKTADALKKINEGTLRDIPLRYYKKKNGTVFPAEISANTFLLNERKVFCGIIRDITERKKAEEELLFKTALLEAQLETSIEGILIVDENDTITLFNTRFREMWNIPQSILDLKSSEKTIDYIIDQIKYPDPFREKIKYLYRNKEEKSSDEVQFKDGKVFERSSCPLVNSIRRYYGRIWYFRDITDLKLAEDTLRQSEEKFNKAFHSNPVVMMISSIDNGDIIEVNEAFLTTLGFQREEVIGKTTIDLNMYINPDQRDDLRRIFLEKGYVRDFEMSVRCRDGRALNGLVSAESIELMQEKYWLIIVQDITPRKQAEEALRKNEAVFRSMLDATQVGVGLLVNRKFQKVNASLCGMTGYAEEEMLGQYTRILYPDDEEYLRVGRELYGQMEREGLGTLEACLRRKDGALINVMLNLSPFDPKDPTAGVAATVLDITERKRAEEELKRSEEKYRELVENANSIILHWDRKGNIIFFNEYAEKLFGYNKNEILGKNVIGTIVSETSLDGKDLISMIQDICDYPERYLFNENENICKDGRRVWINWTNKPLYGEDGSVVGILSIGNDATDRKRIENELRKSEERFRFALNQIPGIMWTVDTELKFTLSTGTALRSIGSAPNQAVGMTVQEYFHTTDPHHIQVEMHRRALNGESISYEYDHQGIFFETYLEPFRDAAGRIIGVLGIAFDTTERKNAEIALSNSEQRMSDIINFLPDATFVIDNEGKVIAWNKAIEEMTGTESTDILGKGNYEYSLSFYGEQRPILIDLVLNKDDKSNLNYLFFQKDKDAYIAETYTHTMKGKEAFLLAKASPLYDSDGNIAGAIESVRDITEQKRVEEALRESEERYRTIFRTVNVALLEEDFSELRLLINKLKDKGIKDFRTYLEENPDFIISAVQAIKIVNVNDAAIKLYGAASKEELLCSLDKIVGLDSLADFKEELICVFQGEKEFEREIINKTIKGDFIYVLVKVSIPPEREKYTNALVSIINITKRKQAEITLKNSERQLSDIIDFLPDATFVIDCEGKVITWNKAIEDMTGVKSEDILGKGDYEYSLPFYGKRRPILIDLALQDDEEINKKYLYVQKHKDSYIAEAYIPSLRGKEVHLWGITNLLYDKDGKVIGAIESIRDITEQKKIEKALRESEEKFRTLAETTTSAIFIYRGEKFVYANPASVTLSGYSQNELLSMTFWDFFHPEYKALIKERGMARQKGEDVIPQYESIILTKEGEERWVEIVTGKISFEGKAAIIATLSNIDKRKRAEESLLKERIKLMVMLKYKSLLADIAAHLNSSDSFQKVVGLLLDKIAHIMEIDSINLYDLHHDSETTNPAGSLIASSDTQEREDSKTIFFPKIPWLFDILKDGKPFISPNIVNLEQEGTEYFTSKDYKAILILPIFISNQMRGMISFSQNHEYTWDAETYGLLKTVTDMIISSWERHILFSARIDAEQKRAEAIQIAERSMRFASIGTVTAGIAHEINQPLNAIKIVVDSMLYWGRKQYDQTKESLKENLIFLSEQVSRIDSIIKHMRVLVKQDKIPASTPMHINDVIHSVLAIMNQQLLSHGIDVVLHLETGIPVVLGYPIQMEQIVINLVSNALHALDLQSQEHKTITIHTAFSNRIVTVEVSDNGPGIPPENLGRLFDPFFTTKSEGMGLGLSISKNIINGIGGTISVENKKEGGAHFTISLPVSNVSKEVKS